MRNFGTLLLVFSALLAAPFRHSIAEKIDWAEAAKKIRYLSPDAFPHAPQNVRDRLKVMGCKIPQADFASDGKDQKPNNLISGSFTKPGAKEWAALCSVNAESRLVVFWGAGNKQVSTLSPSKDRDELQGAGERNARYARFIGRLDSSGVNRYMKRENNAPPSINHDGIEDGVQEKGSLIRYFSGGKWIESPGSG